GSPWIGSPWIGSPWIGSPWIGSPWIGRLMMAWYELADVLIGLVESVQGPPDSGLVVTEAEMGGPVEVNSGWRDGVRICFGAPPHSRWKSGVLPAVHLSRLRVELEP